MLFQILPEYTVEITSFVLSVVFAGSVSVFAFRVSKKHRKGIMAKAYFFMGLGFISYVIAELLYYTFDLIFGIKAYQSISDVFFFFALYPLIMIHLLLNLKYFHIILTRIQKIWIPAIPVFILSLFAMTSLSIPDMGFDFFYGLIFVSGATITFTFTIVGALTFRYGALGVVWLLLLIGLMINAFGDIWYYHLEIFGQYYDGHPVTVIWFVSNLFIIYALYKHAKII
jgi:hypothetical protein